MVALAVGQLSTKILIVVVLILAVLVNAHQPVRYRIDRLVYSA